MSMKPLMTVEQQRLYRLAIAQRRLNPPSYADFCKITREAAEQLLRALYPNYSRFMSYQKKNAREPATPMQRNAIVQAIENGHMESLPEKTWEMLSKSDASMILSIVHATTPPQPATRAQLREIERLIREGRIYSMSSESFNSLSRDKASRLIGIGRCNQEHDVVVPSIDLGFRDRGSEPMTPEQREKLQHLIDDGRVGIDRDDFERLNQRGAGRLIYIGRQREAAGEDAPSVGDRTLADRLMRPIPPTPPGLEEGDGLRR